MTVCLPNEQNSLNPRLNTATPLELASWLLDRSTSIDSVFVEAPKADQKAIQSSITSLQQINPENLALNLETPCLMVYGQNDPAVTLPPIEKSLFLPEHIHQIVFEQSGHFPMLDENSKFNRLLADFLSLGSGDSPRQLQLKEEWTRRVRCPYRAMMASCGDTTVW
jgi:pimeloyl-ACP methyl ester carboxylesterase